MSLEKNITYRYVLNEDNEIEGLRIIRILEDGKEITSYQEGFSVKPGDDYSKEDLRTKDVAGKLHTPEVVAAYVASQAELEAESVA